VILKKTWPGLAALALTAVCASAQIAYQPPDPPFFSGGDGTCVSGDGTVPSYVQQLGQSFTAAQTSCSVGSFFSSSYSPVDVGFSATNTDKGNTSQISVNLTIDNFSTKQNYGAAIMSYVQRFHAPPGSLMAMAFTVQGTGSAQLGIFTDCPATETNCSPYSMGGGVSMQNGPATVVKLCQNGPVIVPPACNMTVGPSGAYVVFSQILTGYNADGAPQFLPPFNMTVTAGCGVGAVLQKNGTEEMEGQAFSVSAQKLGAAAAACGGYKGFDWQQWITNLPCPNNFDTVVHSNLPSANYCSLDIATPGLTAGAAPQFNDVPKGGYTYATVSVADQFDPVGPFNPFPFYWTAGIAYTPDFLLPRFTDDPPTWVPYAVNNGDLTLRFHDAPSDPCLPTPGATPAIQATIDYNVAMQCGGVTAEAGSKIGLTTALVGINQDGSAGPPLFTWQWASDFNGTVGGISTLVTAADPDANSGVGNVTITSINGVPVPPIIPASQIATTSSGLAYSRVTQTFNGTVTITNIGTATITTPSHFQIVLTGLPANVTVANSSGTFNQSPYITIPTAVSLAPGQSASVAVHFANPSNATIHFTPEVYAGTFQ
jgi:hypothetical protein